LKKLEFTVEMKYVTESVKKDVIVQNKKNVVTYISV